MCCLNAEASFLPDWLERRRGCYGGLIMTLDVRARGMAAGIAAAVFALGAQSAFAADTPSAGWTTVVEQTSGKAVPGETASDLYTDAQMYISLREWVAADRLLRAVIERYPDSAAATYARADLTKLRREIFWRSGRSTLGGPIAPAAPRRPSKRPDTSPSWNVFGQQVSLQDQLRTTAGDRLFFAAFSAALGTRNLETLKAQAKWLAGHPDARIMIEAHADEPGTAVDYVAVARARGEAVKAAFVAEGIAPERLSVVAFGRAKRVALCETPACRAQNRRVVVRVTTDASQRAAAQR
jgi:outer membrane protein OmpA-like peptidoglycan-associated protein